MIIWLQGHNHGVKDPAIRLSHQVQPRALSPQWNYLTLPYPSLATVALFFLFVWFRAFRIISKRGWLVAPRDLSLPSVYLTLAALLIVFVVVWGWRHAAWKL